MRDMDMCMAQYILDYFGIDKISSHIISAMLSCNHFLGGAIMRNLGWDKRKLTIKLPSGRYSETTIYRRNGVHKEMRGIAAKKARIIVARWLAVTPEHLQEAC